MRVKLLRRRDFIGLLAGGAAAIALPRQLYASVRYIRDRKPNIVVVMSDEHDPAVTGCYGDKIVRTPNLDGLADRGVLFENYYTTSPLCVPARLSFTSGKYASRVGVWSNSSWLPSADYPSLPRILDGAGYESFLAGKMHYDLTRRYGFRELYRSISNRHYKTGRDSRRKADDESVSINNWKQRSSTFYVGEDSSVMRQDGILTKQCVKFLTQRKAGDKPFFLLVGYLAPHYPLIVPEEYYAPYKDKVPMPNIPEGYLDSLPTNYQQLRRAFGVVETDPAVVKKGRELYWGLVQWFDEQIGKLSAALKESEVADNTIVIYTSDHGESKGDHGMWWKNNMFESAVRVPLIFSWPARWEGGQRRVGACSVVDLVKTIAELSGGEFPEDWDGDSMVAWLDNAELKWKDLAVSEYYGHFVASGFVMLRHGQYKYVYHARMDDRHGPERELYDLTVDPGEYTNLAETPQYKELINTMHKALVKELGRDPEESERICRADIRRGYDREDGILVAGGRTS